MMERNGFSLNRKGNTHLIDCLSLFNFNFTWSSVNAVRNFCLDRNQQLAPVIVLWKLEVVAIALLSSLIIPSPLSFLSLKPSLVNSLEPSLPSLEPRPDSFLLGEERDRH